MDERRSQPHAITPCPACGAPLDASIQIGGGAYRLPRPDDMTVCAYCSALLVYDGPPLRLRFPTAAERAEAGDIFPVEKVQVATQSARLKSGTPTRPRRN